MPSVRPGTGLLCGILLCLLAVTARAEGVNLDGRHGDLSLSHGELAWLCDPGGRLDLAAVQRSTAFHTLAGNLGRGFTHDACWLRLRLHRGPGAAGSWWLAVLPSILDDIRLYLVRPDGSVVFRQSGDHFALASRDAPYSAFLFRLDLPPGDSTAYLRLRTDSSMMALLDLLPGDEFPVSTAVRHLVIGFYLGIMLTAPLLAVAFYVTGRRPLYLVYLAYVGCELLLGFSANGLVAEFLLPDLPGLPDQLVGLSASLSITLGLLFFWLLLDLGPGSPWQRWSALLAGLGGLAGAAAVPLGVYGRVAPPMFWLLLLCVASLLPLVLQRLRSGSRARRLFSLAFGLYLLFLVAMVLPLLGLVPITRAWLGVGQIGVAVHLLALQIAIVMSIHETEQDTLRHRLALEEEARQFEEQRQFLTVLTHEMRTPMAVISSAAQSLRLIDEAAAQPARSQRYQRISEAVRRMDLLMELSVNRDRLSEADPGLLSTVDMVTLSRGIVVQMATEQRRRIRVASTLASAPVLVQAGLLEFTLINLIDNACKYAPANTPIRIEIGGSEASGLVRWRIIDQGPGVAPQDRERIFEKYYRAGEQSGKPGFGLGLYIAWHVVARYRGQLRYVDVGEGACFEITLPWAAPDAQG